MLNFLSLLVRDETCYWLPTRILFIVISSKFLKKPRMLVVSELVVFSRILDWSTVAKKYFSVKPLLQSNFLFPTKSQIQQRKNYNNLKCIFHFGYFQRIYFFRGFLEALFLRAYKLLVLINFLFLLHVTSEVIFSGINFPGGTSFFHFFIFYFLPNLQLLKINKK